MAISIIRPSSVAAATEWQPSMAFIPVLACVQARLQYDNGAGILAENVLYFATTSAPTETDLTDIGDLLHTWVLDSLAPVLSAGWFVNGAVLRAMNEAEGIEINYQDGFPLQGGAAGTVAPNSASYTVTWSTGLVGRSARGRTYGVGLIMPNIVSGNRLSDAARAAFQLRWEALRADMETAGHALQVVSFQEGGVPRTEGRKLPALATNVRFPLATQRRRLT
jgi:hypothetical protein